MEHKITTKQKIFQLYHDNKDSIEGFFTDHSASVFDSLLCFQESSDILGNMLEIGVYKGRSAFLSSLHLRENEVFHLIDFSPYLDEAQKNLASTLDNRGVYYKQKSTLLNRNDFLKQQRKCRWIHIDGEHTGQALWNDLSFCEPLLTDDGIIVIDDFFNPTYPQLTEALYRFLSVNPYSLSLILCGWNKGYLARTLYAPNYLNFIRNNLALELHERNIHEFMICKTTTFQETSCFGIGYRFQDRDYYGLDENPDYIP